MNDYWCMHTKITTLIKRMENLVILVLAYAFGSYGCTQFFYETFKFSTFQYVLVFSGVFSFLTALSLYFSVVFDIDLLDPSGEIAWKRKEMRERMSETATDKKGAFKVNIRVPKVSKKGGK